MQFGNTAMNVCTLNHIKVIFSRKISQKHVRNVSDIIITITCKHIVPIVVSIIIGTHRRSRQVELVRVFFRTGPHGLHVQLFVQGPPVAHHRHRLGRREAASPAASRGRLSVGLSRPHSAGQHAAAGQHLQVVRPVAGLSPLLQSVAGEHRVPLTGR